MSSPSKFNFRYLLRPGTNFQFVKYARTWVSISLLVIAALIALLFYNKSARGQYLNWTIDFSGGTEMVYAFKDKANPGAYFSPDLGEVRSAIKTVDGSFDLTDMTWTEQTPQGDVKVKGVVVRTPRFGAVAPETQEQAIAAVSAALTSSQITRSSWSGDRLFVYSKAPIDEAAAGAALASVKLEMKPWGTEVKEFHKLDDVTGEYKAALAVQGIARQYELAIEKAMGNVDVQVEKSYGVGAKAGDKLRDDAIKSLFYAFLLITLYLAFRFDIRYAPGAIFATLHDAVMVVGIFALTWTEVSLTSVAALLTVIGYSTNDTVVIFDRIRENIDKHPDKKLERIIDLSINETLSRTILTSVTLFTVTLVLNIVGDGLVRNFAFAMNIGVISGTYSTIFMATPLFLWISKRFYGGASAKSTGRTLAEA